MAGDNAFLPVSGKLGRNHYSPLPDGSGYPAASRKSKKILIGVSFLMLLGMVAVGVIRESRRKNNAVVMEAESAAARVTSAVLSRGLDAGVFNKTSGISVGKNRLKYEWNNSMLVKELVSSSVLSEAMKWEVSEGKLDLHGMHLGTTYVMLLQWMEEMRNGLCNGKDVIPAEITVVCGSGKHSNVRGESSVKSMVKDIMFRTKSPMRIDRKNVGCFVAKGKVVKQWLC